MLLLTVIILKDFTKGFIVTVALCQKWQNNFERFDFPGRKV